ncbi:MAG: DUF1289 domain-containing protein [Xanthomonadales bacterium]|nr:DUF1289 domain-containing protein [Xanthomonadales bacterium]
MAAINATGAIDSPCVGVCTLGLGNICIGCLRTSAEIGSWSSFTSQQRSLIMAELPKRLQTLFAE